MGVYGKTPASLAFYNSQDQPIVRHHRLANPQRHAGRAGGGDCPSISAVINAGVGQVWIDDLSLEIVGKDVPVDAPRPSKLPESPTL